MFFDPVNYMFAWTHLHLLYSNNTPGVYVLTSHDSMPCPKWRRTKGHVCVPPRKALILAVHTLSHSSMVWGHRTTWLKSSLNRPQCGHLPFIFGSYFFLLFIVAKKSNSSFNVVIFWKGPSFRLARWQAGQSTTHVVNFFGFPTRFLYDVLLLKLRPETPLLLSCIL